MSSAKDDAAISRVVLDYQQTGIAVARVSIQSVGIAANLVPGVAIGSISFVVVANGNSRRAFNNTFPDPDTAVRTSANILVAVALIGADRITDIVGIDGTIAKICEILRACTESSRIKYCLDRLHANLEIACSVSFFTASSCSGV